MEGDVGVVSEDVKHGDEVNIEEEWADDRALGDTVSYGAGGGRATLVERVLILTEEDRLVM